MYMYMYMYMYILVKTYIYIYIVEMMLSQVNPHPRDRLIVFDEEPHIYTITTDPDSNYTSCTTFIHSFFSHFDADKIIDRMTRSKGWVDSKYYGLTAEQIKERWDQNRDQASAAGTAMHKAIEDFYNGKSTLEELKESPDLQYFLNFYKDIGHTLKPYRSEWMIFDDQLKLAGSIDFVTENEDGTLNLWDWKRSREIRRDTKWQRGLTPVNHLPDTNYYHYSLQLNLYKAILENNYNKTVNQLALVVMHPDQDDYEVIVVPNLAKEICAILNHRIETNNLDCQPFETNETVETEAKSDDTDLDTEHISQAPLECFI